MVLKDLSSLGWIGCIVMIVAISQLLVYKIQFEDLTEIPYLMEGVTDQRATSFDWANPRVASVLFSSFHGLFAWHPIVLIAIVGAFLSIRRYQEFIALLLAFFIQVYFVSSWYNWWQGAAFGGRMFSSCSYVFVMGLASLWSRAKTLLTQRLVVLLTLGFIVWNILLAMQYISRMIPAEEALSMGQIAANQLKVLPFFFAKLTGR